MVLFMKMTLCGVVLLALALGSAGCSVKTPTEGLRVERGDRFKVVDAEQGKTSPQSAPRQAFADNGSAKQKTVEPRVTPAVSPGPTGQTAQAAQAAPPKAVQTAPVQATQALPPSQEQTSNTAQASDKDFTLYFKRGSTEYAKSSQAQVRDIARLLQENPSWRAVIEGYADSRGDPETNQYLSDYRAQRLKHALQRHARISSDRLEAAGRGDANPIADNETAEGRERNRRVTVRFVRVEDGAPVGPLAESSVATTTVAPASSEPVQIATSVAPKHESAKPTETAPTAVSAPVPTLPTPPVQLLTASPTPLRTEPQAADTVKSAHKPVAFLQPSGAADARANAPQPAAKIERASIPKAEDVVYTPLAQDANLLAKRHYVEISVSQCTLSLFELQLDGSKQLVKQYKVATAKKGTPYPEGVGMVTGIETNPWWFPTDNMKRRAASRGQNLEPVPPGSKSNPMGAVKILLSHENDGGSYRIHGTNAPTQIGRRVSMGCVRMHNADGLELAKTISVGTEVNILY